MPGTCCVPMCRNRGGHLFPRDKELKELWTLAVRRGNWRPTTTSIVCKEHFTEDDFSTGLDQPMKARLKRGAVPTKFKWSTKLPSGVSAMDEASQQVEMPTKRKIADLEDSPQLNSIDKPKRKAAVVSSTGISISSAEIFDCRYCSETFAEESELEDHMFIHEDERPFVCSFCKASFRRKFNLKRHETIHKSNKVKAYKCPHCEESFSQGVQMKKHCRTHSSEEPHKCTKCSAVFKKASDLRVHVFRHIQEHQNCSHCGTLCKGLCQLKKHFMTHTRELQFKCSHCSASYAKQNELKLHMRMHTNEKIYDCAQCNVAFRRERDLNKHMNKHTVKKFYKCTHCDAFFVKAVHLKNHSKIHKQPHKCPECNATFIQERRLKDHLMIHTGERPYKCKFCDAAYIRADPLKWHVLRNHSGMHVLLDLDGDPGSSSSKGKSSNRGRKSKSKQTGVRRGRGMLTATAQSKARERVARRTDDEDSSSFSEGDIVGDLPLARIDIEHFVKEELNGNDSMMKEHDVGEGFMNMGVDGIYKVMKEEMDVNDYENNVDADVYLMDDDSEGIVVKTEVDGLDCIVKEECEIDDRLKEETSASDMYLSTGGCDEEETKKWCVEECIIKQEDHEGL